MKHMISCVLLFTAAAAGSGCVGDFPEDDGKRITRHIAMHDEGAIARTRSGKPALIDPGGGLSIEGEEISLTPAQNRLAKRYHDLTAALYADALAMTGAPDAPEHDAAAGDELPLGLPATAPVESESDRNLLVSRICEHVGELEAAQQALADAVPAFKPHATLPANAGELCMQGVSH